VPFLPSTERIDVRVPRADLQQLLLLMSSWQPYWLTIPASLDRPA
jgi:hypothetical protein